MEKLVYAVVALLVVLTLTGCFRDATIASHNLSKDADQFKVRRRVIFYNSITDTYMFEMTGNLSINVDNADRQLEVTVKLGDGSYRKHFLGLSDNVTYIVEQVESRDTSEYKYELVFKPQSFIPISIDLE